MLCFIAVLALFLPLNGRTQGTRCSVFPSDTAADKNTVNLYQNLAALSADFIMIGHQDALSYGVGWNGDADRSDVKDVSGSHPAVYGWDIGGIELEWDKNIDTVPFSAMRANILHVFNQGGVNTISWHAYNPVTGKDAWADTKQKNNTVSLILPGGSHHAQFLQQLDRVAGFLASLKTDRGEVVPIVFRPWHEHSGNWFWWGRMHCTTDEYIALYRFTIEYLRATHHLHNLLIAFSPDIGFTNAAEYLERYPGDDVVDVMGLDDYHSLRSGKPENLIFNLETIAGIAKEKKKISAFTETGCTNVADDQYFTGKLMPCLGYSELTRSVSWVLFWRNEDSKHHFLPYKDHKSAADFKAFSKNPLMLLQNNIPDLYLHYQDIRQEIKRNSLN
ncbi:MAG: beta-mannosidase [Lentimicrobium sp.]|nr:beta-mannosidase [Lentimicrobium sp.]